MSMRVFDLPSAITADSIALSWEKVCGAACYRIELNGAPMGLTAHTDYTLERLSPDTVYDIRVVAQTREGAEVDGSAVCRRATKPRGAVLSIVEYGAVGDGKTVCTQAIQAAIDACPAGGEVYVPQGDFITGALYLKSDITLHIEELGRLLGSQSLADYPVYEYLWEGRVTRCYASLINAMPHHKALRNITICGKGTIDAGGVQLFKLEREEGLAQRGRALYLNDVDGLYLKGVTVRQSPSWCVHFACCNDVCINGLSVYTRKDEYGKVYKDVFNGDGIDPESSSNVCIFNCTIASQDDCIAIKSGRDDEGRRRNIPSRNIRITNCRFLSGFGIALGSEMSGGVRDVFVQDCVFKNAYSIASIKAPWPRGGAIENVLFSDCRISNYGDHEDSRWLRGAIAVDQFYDSEPFDPNVTHPIDEQTPTIRNITFRNIVLDTAKGCCIFLCGLPENPLKGITLENVCALGKTGMKAFHVDGLRLLSTDIRTREGEPICLYDVRCED